MIIATRLLLQCSLQKAFLWAVFFSCLSVFVFLRCVFVARFVLSLLLTMFGALYDRTYVVHGLAETGVGVVFQWWCAWVA